MPVDSRHPQYVAMVPLWETVRDSYGGQQVVKDRATKYLPATRGMIEDGYPNGEPGRSSYNAYRSRAVFHEFVRDAAEALVGVMHRKPPLVELPPQLEPLIERATPRGESLHLLLRRINEAQLVEGRIGLLVEMPTGLSAAATPYLATYGGTSIINWDDGIREDGTQRLELVVLNESEDERQTTLEWKHVRKYRVLALSTVARQMGGSLDLTSGAQLTALVGPQLYEVATVREDINLDISGAEWVVPSVGGRPMEEIPFVFINSKDFDPTPDYSPLLGLANLALTIYRGEADYRQALFMQGQDTLVVIGGPLTEGDPVKAGAGAMLQLTAGSDAKYIGVNSAGLPEMRQALENDKAIANQKSSQLLDNRSKERESGDALSVRMAARTATLAQIAQTGAEGLVRALKHAAVWVGADPDRVIVEPNLDFIDEQIEATSLSQLMDAKQKGLPLSKRSIHVLLRDNEYTDKTFEEEEQELDKESEESAAAPVVPQASFQVEDSEDVEEEGE